jgi:hypothetical protein
LRDRRATKDGGMSLLGRILGWLFVLAAAVVFLRDTISWFDTGHLEPLVVGKLWFDLHPTSLQLAQPAIQRHIAPWLWDPVIVTLLLWWAAPVIAVPGIFLLWASRAANRRRHRPKII